MLRLLKLAEPVQHFVRSGKLSAGHARLLVGVPDAEQIAWRAMELDMSVRQLEDELRADRERHAMDVPEGKKPRKAKAGKDADTRRAGAAAVGCAGFEGDASTHRGEGGTLQIKYKDLGSAGRGVAEVGKLTLESDPTRQKYS